MSASHRRDPATRSSGGHRIELPHTLTTTAYRGWVARTIANHTQDADAMIELGAGWGANLFGSYLAGGPPDARYVAAEYTDACRDAARLLAERAPEVAFEAVAFDFHRPALELPTFRRATVSTAHAIEQIPELPRSLLSFVATLATEVTVLHFEPIGWQINDGPSAYAGHHDYNRNLWHLLGDPAVEIPGRAGRCHRSQPGEPDDPGPVAPRLSQSRSHR